MFKRTFANWCLTRFHSFWKRRGKDLSPWVLLKSSSAVLTSRGLISLYIILQLRSQKLAQQIKNVFFFPFFFHLRRNLCAASFVAGSSLPALTCRWCDQRTNLLADRLVEQRPVVGIRHGSHVTSSIWSSGFIKTLGVQFRVCGVLIYAAGNNMWGL